MQRWIHKLALALALAGGVCVHGDILYLRDGSRHYGELISQDEGVVQFRVVTDADDLTGVVRSYAKAMVSRVQRTGRVDQPPATTPAAPAEQPATPDYDQLIREGLELLADRDFRAALRALQLVVTSAKGVHLERAERLAEKMCGMPLDETLARTRMYVACGEGRERGFKLRFATRYEAAALARLLKAHLDTLLAREYDGRTVREWAGAADEVTQLQPYTWALFEDAARATITLAAWMRYDASLRGDRRVRATATQLYLELGQLGPKLRDLPGYTDPVKRAELKAIEWVDPVLPPPVPQVRTHPAVTQPQGLPCGPLTAAAVADDAAPPPPAWPTDERSDEE